MTPIEIGLVAAVLLAGAALQTGVGFGMNVVAAPLLVLIDRRLVPGPLVASALVLTVLIARRERAHVDWTGFRWIMVGRVPGTVIAALVVAALPPRGTTIAVGVAVLVTVGLNFVKGGLSPTPAILTGAGFASGISGTLTSIGGPFLAVVYARRPGPVVRATLSVIFVIAASISLVALAAVGEFGGHPGLLALAIQPAVIAGFFLGRPLAAHLDAGRTRSAVIAVSLIGALVVLATELF